MPDPGALAAFLGVIFMVAAIPGPSVLYTVSRTLDEGVGAGLLSVIGLALGTAHHAVAVGVVGLLASSEAAFHTLDYAGAAHLAFLGVRKLRNRSALRPDPEGGGRSGRGAFVESLAVGLLNPRRSSSSPRSSPSSSTPEGEGP